MRKFPLVFFLLVTFFALSVGAQPLRPGVWKSYTSMRTVTGLAMSPDSSTLWVSTSGGAFGVQLREDDSLTAFRTTEGLSGNDLSSIGVDDEGTVYFGGSTGGFDLLRSTSTEIERRPDIRNQASLTNKSIRKIYAVGSKTYLATDFGLSVFSTEQGGYFVTTANRIANLPQQDSVNDVLEADGNIYLAMAEGVAVADAGSDLSNPAVWKVVATTGNANCLVDFHGRLVIGTDSGLCVLSGDSTIGVDGISKMPINGFATTSDSLYALVAAGTVYSTSDLGLFHARSITAELGASATSIAVTKDGFLILGTSNEGVFIQTYNGWTPALYPSGPVFNDVTCLSYSSEKGELFVAHGEYGVSVFNMAHSTWIAHSAGTTIPRGIYTSIFYDPIRQYTWASLYGTGLCRFSGLDGPTPTDTIFGAASIPDWDGSGFVVPGGQILDRDGNLCSTVWGKTGNAIVRTSDGTHFTPLQLYQSAITGKAWQSITQDMDGNYWVGTQYRDIIDAMVGLAWYNAGTGAFGAIIGAPGNDLPSPGVNALLTDQDDGIWCGTEDGVQILSNPYAIDAGSPQFYIRDVKLLDGQAVNAMAVDGVGNKWIATNNGLFVLSPDGTDSIARYTSENSPLVSDAVFAVAIDKEHGEVYAGTAAGISRFSTIFKSGLPSYDALRVYPNPLVQNAETSPEVTITGLVAGSTVKIFTVSGKLVATIDGSLLGATVTWDGRDSAGHAVSSGLYLISASSPQSGDNGAAKLVIVREP